MKRDDIIAQLLDTMNVAKRSMLARMHRLVQESPVSPAHLELLGAIAQLQPISAKQLASHMQLTPGAVSQLVDGLARKQLIHRETLPEDRRTHYLGVSKGGKALLERINKPRNAMMTQLMAQLTDEELAVWLRIQQIMIAHFEATEPDKPIKGDKT